MLKKKSDLQEKPVIGSVSTLSRLFEHTAIRYLFVGGSAYIIEMIALYTLRYSLNFSPLISVAISFWVGFFIAFVLQKTITFQNYERSVKTVTKQLFGYSMLVAFNYGITLLVVSVLHEKLNVLILRTATIATITLWNYYIYGKLFRLNSNA
jgi:putative flippase GtrA